MLTPYDRNGIANINGNWYRRATVDNEIIRLENAIEAAVVGRKDFRQAYREQKTRAEKAEAELVRAKEIISNRNASIEKLGAKLAELDFEKQRANRAEADAIAWQESAEDFKRKNRELETKLATYKDKIYDVFAYRLGPDEWEEAKSELEHETPDGFEEMGRKIGQTVRKAETELAAYKTDSEWARNYIAAILDWLEITEGDVPCFCRYERVMGFTELMEKCCYCEAQDFIETAVKHETP